MAKSWIVPFCFTFLVILGAFLSVESLQCYECENCPSTLNETFLVTCNGTIPDFANNATNPDVSTNGTSTNLTAQSAPNSLRDRRSIELDIDPDRACLCLGVECSCDEEGALLRAIQSENNTWVCGSATYRENGTDVVFKGCVPNKVNDQEFCPWLKNYTDVVVQQWDNTTELTKCTTCTTDKCNGDDNGASSLHSSVAFALFTVAMLAASK